IVASIFRNCNKDKRNFHGFPLPTTAASPQALPRAQPESAAIGLYRDGPWLSGSSSNWIDSMRSDSSSTVKHQQQLLQQLSEAALTTGPHRSSECSSPTASTASQIGLSGNLRDGDKAQLPSAAPPHGRVLTIPKVGTGRCTLKLGSVRLTLFGLPADCPAG
uniref:Ski_Sno domain-containing protein n=1 Tax=Macrostomum lignano TaxID=282301 RepID=A0A1I8F530_9PLAT